MRGAAKFRANTCILNHRRRIIIQFSNEARQILCQRDRPALAADVPFLGNPPMRVYVDFLKQKQRYTMSDLEGVIQNG